ncbi:MAG: FAD:protein FMN transferase [Candidatus Eisenbacteria sp.]|nr:FAD:protein FMN transferase [Candidatus Eisenbacteria bacterium]
MHGDYRKRRLGRRQDYFLRPAPPTARAAATLLILLFPILACTPDGRPSRVAKYVASRDVMSTVASITLVADTPEEAGRAMDAAFAALDSVEAWMSAYRSEGDLARVNAMAARRPVPVGKETFDVLRAAERFTALTGGAFDVTVGPLIVIWRDGASSQRLPHETELRAVRGRVGMSLVSLDAATQSVTFARSGVRIDLGGIAKGYAIDQAVDAARAAGVEAGLIEVGGDLRCFGRIPRALVGLTADRMEGDLWRSPDTVFEDLQPWPLGIQDPFEEDLLGKIRIPEGAVATSGHYRRFSLIEGHRISHILDPRSGWPVTDPASVTVIAPDALTADALATALSVLGAEKGLALADSLPGVEALIVGGDAAAPRRAASAGFPPLEPLGAANAQNREGS